MYTFWHVDMPDVTVGYGRFSDIMRFLEFLYRITCLKHYNSIKLLQIEWQEVQGWKSKHCYLLWSHQSSFCTVFVVKLIVIILQANKIFLFYRIIWTFDNKPHKTYLHIFISCSVGISNHLKNVWFYESRPKHAKAKCYMQS